MPGPNRGALPLALLILAVLATGIVVAVTRDGGLIVGEPPRSPDGPSPGLSPTTPAPETPDSPTPESPTPAEPTDEAAETPDVRATPLAETGGPGPPWLGAGVAMVLAGLALWRFSRGAS